MKLEFSTQVMKFISYFILISYSLQLSANSTTIRNPDHNRAARFEYAIELFYKNTGHLPRSWSELRQLKESENYVKIVENYKIDGKVNDFIQTFRFIPSTTELRIKSGRERIIAMATRSVLATKSTPPDEPPARLLVVQTEDGEIDMKRYTEENIATLFQMAGYNIADYTGPDGKWAVEPEFQKPESDPTSAHHQITEKDLPESWHKEQNRASKRARPESPVHNNHAYGIKETSIIVIASIAVLLLAYLAWKNLSACKRL